jgi:hypothetical protein
MASGFRTRKYFKISLSFVAGIGPPQTRQRTGRMGAAAPTRVAVSEWDSLEKAEAFYKSKGFLDLAPERDKAETVTRLYAVEALPN